MVMKLQIVMLKKLLRWTLAILVLALISLDSAVSKDGSYYPQVLLKECKYIKKKVIRYIIDDLESSFGGSDDSDNSNEE